MRIIISPAKQMKEDTDNLPFHDLPVFLPETEKLKEWIRSLTLAEAKKLWACSDRIAKENYERFRDMELKKNLTPAIALSPAFSVNSKTKKLSRRAFMPRWPAARWSVFWRKIR